MSGSSEAGRRPKALMEMQGFDDVKKFDVGFSFYLFPAHGII
jgi:hypothetical protein